MTLREILRQLRSLPAKHWSGVGLSLVFAIGLVQIGGYRGWWRDADDAVYEILHDLQPMKEKPEVVVVEIDDEEYWKGDLAYRAPIRRDYLARLLAALASAGPEVIALDFDLRSPTPDGNPLEHPDYAAETHELFAEVETIERLPNPPYIVLPATLGRDVRGEYIHLSDIYGSACIDLQAFGQRVSCGYIQLPYDHRQVPMQVGIAGGGQLDSLSLAIARAHNPNHLDFVLNGSLASMSASGYARLPYADFPKPSAFDRYSAASIVHGVSAKDREALFARVVLVGATWHKVYPMKDGTPEEAKPDYADGHWSPVGDIPGVYLHAMYADSLIHGRVFKPWSRWVVVAIDALLIIGAILLFSLEFRAHIRFGLFTAGCVGLALLSYIAWSNLGIFFNAFILVVALALHFLADQIHHWRSHALDHAKRHTRTPKEA